MFALFDRVIVGHLAARRSSSQTPNAEFPLYNVLQALIWLYPPLPQIIKREFGISNTQKSLLFFSGSPAFGATKKEEESLKILAPLSQCRRPPKKTYRSYRTKKFSSLPRHTGISRNDPKKSVSRSPDGAGGEEGGGHVTRQRHRPSPYCFVINKRMRSWKHRFGENMFLWEKVLCTYGSFTHTLP